LTILFIAYPDSIHTVRWISQLKDTGWDIHLFPCMNSRKIHEGFDKLTYHESFYKRAGINNKKIKAVSPHLHFIGRYFHNKISNPLRLLLKLVFTEKSIEWELAKTIRTIKPDFVHTLETQQSGYLLSKVQKEGKLKLPFWIHSIWGIDLHFFGRLELHRESIFKVLFSVDQLIVEGTRDKILAEKYGYRKETKVFPSVGGGFKQPLFKGIQTSLRKKILVKGTQDEVRRGLCSLRALQRCVDVLKDFEIILYNYNNVTATAAHLFYAATGKEIVLLNEASHEQMLQLNSEARLSICTNMSDGLPNSMLEAMLMGAFPIQSDTSIADEWILNGETGFLVPPEDPEEIETAIRNAVLDDGLVDKAAITNHQKIISDLPYDQIKQELIQMYSEMKNKQIPVK
jgi:glycosyltransferase involved in cell wall biosynthesis